MSVTEYPIYLKKIIAALVLVSFTACAMNPRRIQPLTPAEQQQRQQAEFFSESGITACLVAGGAAGLLVGLLNKSKDRYAYAAIAAVAACGVAAGANYYLEAKRLEHADNESRLNVMITDIRNENTRLNGLIATTKQVIWDDKAKFARINARYKQKALSKKQATDQLASVEENRKFLQQTLTKLKSREEEWRRVSITERQSAVNTVALDREISQLQQRVAFLRRQLEEYDQIRIIEKVG
ncbi:MAG: hypothetical protein L0Y39_01940 [Methylococcaceae bacterium]|nr:hypothetical protein [Methylococcaceae bacterium]